MKTIKKIIIALLVMIIAIPMFGLGYAYFKLNSVYDKEEAKKIEKIEIAQVTEGITNILVTGIDGNNLEKGNRSDSMIIMTIDTKNNDIRLTSLARDTYVDIPGHGTEKLTHAYAYGGPALLLETISNNFGIGIDKYVSVSFDSFVKIIDILGGVEIDVLSKEVSHISGIDQAGLQTLNGKQALSYSRIRKADSAYERDNRQRTVIQSVYNKLSSPSSSLIDVGNTILSYTKTNMSPFEILDLANKAIKINDNEFDQMEFPLEEHRNGHIINKQKGWVIEWDKEPNLKALNEFIYGNNL